MGTFVSGRQRAGIRSRRCLDHVPSDLLDLRLERHPESADVDMDEFDREGDNVRADLLGRRFERFSGYEICQGPKIV